MAVYVDDAFVHADWGRWTGGGHLQADSLEELEAFAEQIGVWRGWLQSRPGRPDRDHFDLTREGRERALAAGAIAETAREGVIRRRALRPRAPGGQVDFRRSMEQAGGMVNGASGSGTIEDPWKLRTPPGTSEFEMYRDEAADPPVLVCTVGKTKLAYQLRAIEDLHAMLVAHGDWIPLGSADEQKTPAEGTVEAWGRSPDNPVGGFYGTKKGLRGRFGMYVPPVLEALGLAEVEHAARNNRMRAI